MNEFKWDNEWKKNVSKHQVPENCQNIETRYSVQDGVKGPSVSEMSTADSLQFKEIDPPTELGNWTEKRRNISNVGFIIFMLKYVSIICSDIVVYLQFSIIERLFYTQKHLMKVYTDRKKSGVPPILCLNIRFMLFYLFK